MLRPGFARAVSAILATLGENGKPMSLRQAARLSGLSPATVGELATGNPRTAQAIRRFAEGLGQDPGPLLMLAGYTPPDGNCRTQLTSIAAPEGIGNRVEHSLSQWAEAFSDLRSHTQRELFLAGLEREVQLMRLSAKHRDIEDNRDVSGTIVHS